MRARNKSIFDVVLNVCTGGSKRYLWASLLIASPHVSWAAEALGSQEAPAKNATQAMEIKVAQGNTVDLSKGGSVTLGGKFSGEDFFSTVNAVVPLVKTEDKKLIFMLPE